MKKNYVKPELEVVEFNSEEILEGNIGSNVNGQTFDDLLNGPEHE